jgi:hypothetical protein
MSKLGWSTNGMWRAGSCVAAYVTEAASRATGVDRDVMRERVARCGPLGGGSSH